MCAAGEQSVALKTAIEIAQTEWRYVKRWQMADLYLIIAGIYWWQKEFVKCLVATARAVAIRPKVVGRYLKPLLQRLGLV